MLKRYLIAIKHYSLGAGIAGAFILAYGLAGNADMQEQERQAERYCQMTALWAETGGDAGWPPYLENVNCEDE